MYPNPVRRAVGGKRANQSRTNIKKKKKEEKYELLNLENLTAYIKLKGYIEAWKME